jgi:hypothetical protein
MGALGRTRPDAPGFLPGFRSFSLAVGIVLAHPDTGYRLSGFAARCRQYQPVPRIGYACYSIL